jgi:phage-related protein (TIGR01555 family)
LQNVYEHLQILGSSIGSIGALLDEVSVGKYKLANLVDILDSPDGEKLVKMRMEVMDLCRSVFNSIYLDKDDEYTRDNVSFTGIPEVLYNIYMLVSACTGYPITRLFGVSPAGMNSTGESDMRNYYDMVRSTQRTEIEPLVLRLVRIIAEWKNLEEPYIEWKPLQQLSEKEKAEKDKMEADKDQVIATTWKAYIDASILEPYQAAYLQFGDSLAKISIPDELLLPPVEDVPDEEEEKSNGKEKPEGEESTEKGPEEDTEEDEKKKRKHGGKK